MYIAKTSYIHTMHLCHLDPFLCSLETFWASLRKTSVENEQLAAIQEYQSTTDAASMALDLPPDSSCAQLFGSVW